MTEFLHAYIVDSFTKEAFKGNPAGVCIVEQTLNDSQMQTIAIELGLSETAFIQVIEEETVYGIRYFSPKMEIPLCGHATLAASKVIFERFPTIDHLSFTTKHGLELPILRKDQLIVMEFPIYDTIPMEAPQKLLDALGILEINTSAYNSETEILLLEIEDSEALSALEPNFEQLVKSHNSINGVLVTAKSSNPLYDFESRYFWPWSGTNEDPVTGGTHTFLAKFWAEKLDKSNLKSFQCSERTGSMEIDLISTEKMLIKSEAQIIFIGKIRMP